MFSEKYNMGMERASHEFTDYGLCLNLNGPGNPHGKYWACSSTLFKSEIGNRLVSNVENNLTTRLKENIRKLQ